MARAPCRLRCHNKILPKSDWRPASGPRLMAMDGRYTAPRHPKRTLRRCINYRPSCAHRCTLHTAHANWRHSRSLGRIQFSHIQWVACQRLSCVRYPCASGLQSNHVRKRYCRAEITSADGVQFVHLAGVYASERRDVAGMDGNCHRLGHAVFRWSGVGCPDGGVGACLVTGSVQRSVRSSHTGYRHLCWCTRRRTRFVSGGWATSVIQLGNALNFSRIFSLFHCRATAVVHWSFNCPAVDGLSLVWYHGACDVASQIDRASIRASIDTPNGSSRIRCSEFASIPNWKHVYCFFFFFINKNRAS